MDAFDIDAYSPAQIAARVEKVGITKGNMEPLSTLVLAMLAGAFISFAAASGLSNGALNADNSTWYSFLIGNLLPVTIGNIIGGGFFIGAVYCFVYLRRSAVEPVRRLMTKGPPAVSADTTIAEAIEIMKAHDSSSVLVGELGSASGLLDESDIVKKAVLKGLDVNTTRISEVMSSPLISVDIKASVYGIYRTLAEKRIRHITSS